MQKSCNRLPGKQRGAVLVVALIMLVLLSLLGVNSLKNSLHTERMAAVVHQKNITFQASESAAKLATDENSSVTVVADAIRTNGPVGPVTVDINSNFVTSTVTAEPLGAGAVFGNSIGDVGGLRVLVTSTAGLNSDPGTQTVIVQGITRLGPGGL